jgi:3-oxoacyl-[acyl-carrier protein] reductase
MGDTGNEAGSRKVAVVTGAGRGIGRAVALRLAADGCDVVVNYSHSAGPAEEVVRECDRLGARAVAMQADVADHDEAKALIDAAVDRFGTIDVLVNNAGITRDGLLVRMSPEDFERVVRVNLEGTFFCMKHASRLMLKRHRGAIVNIASIVGITGNAGQVNYAASKAGVIGMTKTAARELASRGVRVNAVAPGFIDTDMTRALSDDAREALEQKILLSRLGKPEDIAAAVAFLASDDASYITGQVLCVDGGIAL